MIVSKKSLLALVCLGLMVGCSGSLSPNKQKNSYNTKLNGSIEWNGNLKRIKNLYWQDQEISTKQKFTWNEARDYCSNLSLNGFSSFRLPSITELIILRKQFDKSKDTLTFMNGSEKRSQNLMTFGYSYFNWDDSYWSKDIDESGKKAKQFQCKGYDYKYSSYSDKSSKANVRCVTNIGNYPIDLSKATDIKSFEKIFVLKYGYPYIKLAHYDNVTKKYKIYIAASKGGYFKTIEIPVAEKDKPKMEILLTDSKFIPTIQFEVKNGKLKLNGIKELKNYSSYVSKQYKESTTSKEKRRKAFVTQEIAKMKRNWLTMELDEFYKLISGNTLIGKSKMFCPDDSSKESCLKIAILSKEDKVTISRHPVTVIYSDKKKILKDEWGYYAMNLTTMGIHTGITTIPTDSRYNFKELVYINKNKTMFRVVNPKLKTMIQVLIQKGQNKKFIEDAQNGNYKAIDNTGSMSVGQALFGKAIKAIGKTLKEGAEYARTHPNANNSTNIENTKDVKSQTSSSKSSTPQRAKGGVKRVYVGSRSGGYAHYVVNCENGKSYSDLSKKSDGYWHRGSAMSNMGDDYKGLSINAVAEKLCR